MKQQKKEQKRKSDTVVYCQFYECIHNKNLAEKKSLSDFRPGYEPLFPKEAEVRGVCTKEEIVLYRGISGKSAAKLPDCFVFSNKTDHALHWANLLDSNGSPFGGSLESQSHEYDYGSRGYM